MFDKGTNVIIDGEINGLLEAIIFKHLYIELTKVKYKV